jgi:hypothetical protein
MRKIIFVLAVLGLVGFVWGADAHIGTWKLNPAKTKVTGPGPTYQTGTATFEAQENGFKLTYDQVTADGKTVHGEFAAKYDGKDYPVKGDPDTDAVSMRRINDRTFDYIYKKAGKEVMREHDVISSDGKTANVTFKGKSPKGEDYTVATVWEKK